MVNGYHVIRINNFIQVVQDLQVTFDYYSF